MLNSGQNDAVSYPEFPPKTFGVVGAGTTKADSSNTAHNKN